MFLLYLVNLSASPLYSQITTDNETNTVIVENAPEMEVISYGKTVIVRGRAKGVLTFGGDIIIEGRIDGDVAAIGGSVVQKQDAFIGGDLFVIGGKYKPESLEPLRDPAKETVMYAGYEDELRDLAQNPTHLLSPEPTLAFFAQRVLSVLFWLMISLAFATIAPGAVSRAVARLNLSGLKVAAAGSAALLLATVAMVLTLTFLPAYLTAGIGLMVLAFLLLAFVFGRVALNVAVGKLVQKNFLSLRDRSETLAILIGVIFWTVLLSLPYIWTVVVFVVFVAGIGLVLTTQKTGRKIPL